MKISMFGLQEQEKGHSRLRDIRWAFEKLGHEVVHEDMSCDIALVSAPVLNGDLIDLVTKLKDNKKYIVFDMIWSVVNNIMSYGSDYMNINLFNIEKKVLQMCDVILTGTYLNTGLFMHLYDLPFEKFLIWNIYAHTDNFNSSFTTPKQKSEIKQELGLKDNDFLLLYHGISHPTKEIQRAFLPFGRLHDRLKNEIGIESRFLLLTNLLESVDDFVITKDYIEQNETVHYLNACDCYLGDFGNNVKEQIWTRTGIWEAVNCKKPVVVVQTFQMFGHFTPEEMIYLTANNREKDFVTQICDAIKQEKLESIGQKAYDKSVENNWNEQHYLENVKLIKRRWTEKCNPLTEITNRKSPGKIGECWVGKKVIDFFIEQMKDKESFLEIGTYHGIAISLLAERYPNKMFYTIDPFVRPIWHNSSAGNFDYFLKNTKGLDNIVLLKGKSEDILPTLNMKFDIIFIDGEHEENGVKSDLEKCYPLLAKKGLLCVHDYINDVVQDVKKAVDKFCQKNKYKFNIFNPPNKNDVDYNAKKLDSFAYIHKKEE